VEFIFKQLQTRCTQLLSTLINQFRSRTRMYDLLCARRTLFCCSAHACDIGGPNELFVRSFWSTGVFLRRIDKRQELGATKNLCGPVLANSTAVIVAAITRLAAALGSAKSWSLDSTHFFGTYVQVDEPYTASHADIRPPNGMKIGRGA
jgi:hypothetical protein